VLHFETAESGKLAGMLRPIAASLLAALSLATGFHASVAAAPPVMIECQTPLPELPVVNILIDDIDEGKVRDAVQKCVFFWGGHPSGAIH
jgi:hypothetical protein